MVACFVVKRKCLASQPASQPVLNVRISEKVYERRLERSNDTTSKVMNEQKKEGALMRMNTDDIYRHGDSQERRNFGECILMDI